MNYGHYTYQQSKVIAAEDYPFYSLIMAAMRQADSANLSALIMAFPDVYEELDRRYNAPGGYLLGDPESPYGDVDPESLPIAERVEILRKNSD